MKKALNKPTILAKAGLQHDPDPIPVIRQF